MIKQIISYYYVENGYLYHRYYYGQMVVIVLQRVGKKPSYLNTEY